MKQTKKIVRLVLSFTLLLLTFSGCTLKDELPVESTPLAEVPSVSLTEAPDDNSLPSEADLLKEKYKIPDEGESKIFDQIMKTGKIKAGVAICAPWLLQDPATGNYVGPTVDLMNKICEVLGVEVEYVDSEWKTIVAGLQSNKFDLIIAPLNATEARMEVIDFVNYSSAGLAYACSRNNEKAMAIKSLEELDNPDITIITMIGGASDERIRGKYTKANIYSIMQPPGGLPAIEEVMTGRGDFLHLDSPLALKIAKEYPELSILTGAENALLNPDIPTPVGMGINKNDEAFHNFLQAIVDDMEEHTQAEIMKFSQAD